MVLLFVSCGRIWHQCKLGASHGLTPVTYKRMQHARNALDWIIETRLDNRINDPSCDQRSCSKLRRNEERLTIHVYFTCSSLMSVWVLTRRHQERGLWARALRRFLVVILAFCAAYVLNRRGWSEPVHSAVRINSFVQKYWWLMSGGLGPAQKVDDVPARYPIGRPLQVDQSYTS